MGGRLHDGSTALAVQGLSMRQVVGFAVAAIGVPALSALALPEGWAVLGGVGALLGAVASVAVGWSWMQALALPLEIAPCAAVGVLDGHRAYWVRARLGLGRGVSGARFVVRWRGEDGHERRLDVVEPSGPCVGAFTAVAIDRDGVSEGAGKLSVEVLALGAGQSHAAAREITDLKPGRFAAPVDGGGVVRGGAWCRVEGGASAGPS